MMSMSDFLTTQEHVSSYVDDLSRKEGWFIFSAWVWNALVFWLAMVIMSALAYVMNRNSLPASKSFMADL